MSLDEWLSSDPLPLQRRRRDEEDRRRNPVLTSPSEPPDEIGRRRTIEDETGIPAPDAFGPDAERAMEARQFSDIETSNPRLARWLSDSNNYAIARDDIDNLSVFEMYERGLRGLRDATRGQVDAAMLATPFAFDYMRANRQSLAPENSDPLQLNQRRLGQEDVELSRLQDRLYEVERNGADPLSADEMARLEELTNRTDANDYGTFIVGPTMRLFPQVEAAIGAGLEGSEEGRRNTIARLMDPRQAVRDSVESGRSLVDALGRARPTLTPRGLSLTLDDADAAQAYGAVRSSAFSGGPAGLESGVRAAEGYFGQGYRMERGGLYAELRREGLSVAVAGDAADAYAATATGIELVGAVTGFRLSAVGGLAARTVGRRALIEGARPLARASLAATANVAEGAIEQAAEESLQETAQILYAEYARQDQVGDPDINRVWREAWTPENIERVLQAGYIGAQGGAGMAAPATGVNLAMDIDAVRRAERAATVFEDLARAAQASRTAERHGPSFEAAVDAASDGAQVWLDADRVAEHFQGLGQDAVSALTSMGLSREAVVAAIAAHGSIQMPLSRFAGRILRDPQLAPLQEHARTDPTAATIAEARAAGEALKQTAEEVSKEMLAQAETVNETAQMLEARFVAQAQESAAQGGMRASVARPIGRMVRAMATTMLSRAQAGAGTFAERMDAEFRRLAEQGGRSGPPVREETWNPPEGVRLTERERKIAEMAINGAGNDWIAEEMDSSRNTVGVTLNKVKRLLGGQAPWEAGKISGRFGMRGPNAPAEPMDDGASLVEQGGRSGPPVREETWNPPEGVRLTEHERKIAEMAINGAGNDWIAEEMDSSRNTVGVTLNKVKRLLGGQAPWEAGKISGRPTEVPTETLVRARERMRGSVLPNRINARLAEQFGMTPQAVSVRLLKYDRDRAQSGDLGQDGAAPTSIRNINNTSDEALAAWYDANVKETETDWGVQLTLYSRDGMKRRDVRIELQAAGDGSFDGVTFWNGGTERKSRFERAPTPEETARANRIFVRGAAAVRVFAQRRNPKRISFSGATEAHDRMYRTMLSVLNVEGYEARQVATVTQANVPDGVAIDPVARELAKPRYGFAWVREDVAANEPIGDTQESLPGAAPGTVTNRTVSVTVLKGAQREDTTEDDPGAGRADRPGRDDAGGFGNRDDGAGGVSPGPETGQAGELNQGGRRDPVNEPGYRARLEPIRARFGQADALPLDGEERSRTAQSGNRGDAARTPERISEEPAARGEQLRSIVGVSGVKIRSRADPLGGQYSLEIDTPFVSEADFVLQSLDKSPRGPGATGIDFDLVDGYDSQDPRLPGIYIRYTSVHRDAKGTGVGTWLYRQLIDWADEQGFPVYSDASVSAAAGKVYPRLREAGYTVHRFTANFKETSDGEVSTDYKPIYVVSKRRGAVQALEAAPPPEGGYQIDGPSLRERLAQAQRQSGDVGQPIFYSAVAAAIEQSTTARASGAQWWATISKAPGVKKEELEWIGLEDWLRASDELPSPAASDNLPSVDDLKARGFTLELYHKTAGDFEEFKPFQHFGTAAQANMRAVGQGANVRPVLVRGTKWKRMRDTGSWRDADLRRLEREGYDGVVYLNRYEGVPLEEFESARERGIDVDSLPDSKFKKVIPSASDSYIVFSPSNIRSRLSESRPARKPAGISRDDVLAFVRENGVRVEETVLGDEIDPARSRDIQSRLLPLIEERDRLTRWQEGHSRRVHSEELEQITEAEKQQYRDNARRLAEIRDQMALIEQEQAKLTGGNRTRWSRFQLPGGENYRELLLRLPERDRITRERTTNPQGWGGGPDGTEGFIERGNTGADFRSSHFDQPNILAHVRFNERVDANGKRTLFIEEVQSDWHQAGRERGYKEPGSPDEIAAAKATIARFAEMEARGETWSREQDRELQAAIDLESGARYGNAGRVPDAPFKNNAWASLALKRMIRWAAENGFDQIAWTPGQVQVERFNLGNFVNRIRLRTYSDGSQRVEARARSGEEINQVLDERRSLEDVVGKEAAAALRAAEAVPSRTVRGSTEQVLDGDGLQVGGHGMTAFYDRILVNIANDLGKKFGARVGEAEIGVPPPTKGMTTDQLAEALEGRERTTPLQVHALPITDAMREAAMEGQALFQQPGAEGRRGALKYEGWAPGRFGDAMVKLFDEWDESTPLHEVGGHLFHLILESMALDPEAPADIKQMWADTLSWWGVDQATWSRLDFKGREPYFEQWARTFEAYAMEGKAPSLQLRDVFQTFMRWLLAVYRDIRTGRIRLNHNLSPEITRVFDRMLATDAEIAEARAMAGADVKLKREHFRAMSDEEWAGIERAYVDAEQAQENDLRARTMATFARRQKRWWRAEREARRDEAMRDVDADPARRAEVWLSAGEWVPVPPVDLDEDAGPAPQGLMLAMPEGLPEMTLDPQALAADWPGLELPASLQPRTDLETVLAEAMKLKRATKDKQAQRLWAFIKQNGRINLSSLSEADRARVIRAMGGPRKTIGVVDNVNGKSPEEIMRLAARAGYFGAAAARDARGESRPSPAPEPPRDPPTQAEMKDLLRRAVRFANRDDASQRFADAVADLGDAYARLPDGEKRLARAEEDAFDERARTVFAAVRGWMRGQSGAGSVSQAGVLGQDDDLPEPNTPAWYKARREARPSEDWRFEDSDRLQEAAAPFLSAWSRFVTAFEALQNSGRNLPSSIVEPVANIKATLDAPLADRPVVSAEAMARLDAEYLAITQGDEYISASADDLSALGSLRYSLNDVLSNEWQGAAAEVVIDNLEYLAEDEDVAADIQARAKALLDAVREELESARDGAWDFASSVGGDWLRLAKTVMPMLAKIRRNLDELTDDWAGIEQDRADTAMNAADAALADAVAAFDGAASDVPLRKFARPAPQSNPPGQSGQVFSSGIGSDRQPDIEELIAALVADLEGSRQVYSALEPGALPEAQRRASARQWFEARGIDLSANKETIRAQIAAALEADAQDVRAVHPDEAAPFFGFGSGDELVRALAALKPRAQAIEERIDAITERDLGDQGSPERVKRAALDAAHVETTARAIEMELAAITKAAGGRVTPASKRAQEAAADMLQAMTLAEIGDGGVFLAGERRAAKRAMDAMAKGDMAEAARQKSRQLLSFHLYRQALAIHKQAVRMRERWDRYAANPTTRAAIGPKHIEQIDAILDMLETGRVNFRPEQTLAEWVAEREAADEADLLTFNHEVLAATIRRPLKQLQWSEVQDVDDALRNIETIGRNVIKLKNAREAQRIADIQETLRNRLQGEWSARLAAKPSKGEPPPVDGRMTVKDIILHFDAVLLQLDYLFRYLDGLKDGGPFMELGAALQAASSDEVDRMRDATQQFIEIIKQHYTKEEMVRAQTKALYIPAIDGARTKSQIIAYALNLGNQYNRDALLQGEGWSEAQLQAVIANLDDRDWGFVQALWNYVGQWKEESFALDERTRGSRPPEVLAQPFTTPTGRTLSGGYWPVAFSTRRSDKAAEREARETIIGVYGSSFRQAATNRGRLKARQGTGKQALSNDWMGVLQRHATDSIRDITHREIIITLRRVKADPELRDMIVRVAGTDALKSLDAVVHRVAQRSPADTFGSLQPVARFFNRNNTLASMGFKFTVAIMNLTGFLQPIPRNGIIPQMKQAGITVFGGFFDLLGRHVAAFATGKKEASRRVALVYSKSDMMRNRYETFDRDMSDARRAFVGRPNLLRKAPAPLIVAVGEIDKAKQDFAHILSLYVDKITAIPTWLAAYETAMSGKVGGVKAEEQAAIDYADSVVRMTLSSGAPKDLSALTGSTNEWQRMWTQFMGWANMYYNQMRWEQFPGLMSGKLSFPRFAANMFWIWALPAVIQAVFYGDAEQGEDESDEEYAARMAMLIAVYPLGAVPYVRDAMAATVLGWRPQPVLASATERLQRLSSAGGDILSGEGTDEDARQVVKQSYLLSGLLLGLPTQFYTTGDYLVDLAQGEEDPMAEDALEEAFMRDTR